MRRKCGKALFDQVFLAIKRDPWLAMVVGTNVFLPGFVAFFGKYLVMLRLRPEGEVGGVPRMAEGMCFRFDRRPYGNRIGPDT